MGRGWYLIVWEMEQKKRRREWTDAEVQALLGAFAEESVEGQVRSGREKTFNRTNKKP